MDGLSYATPFSVALLHVAEVPRRGPTHFLPLHPLVLTMRRQQPGWWERLSMRCGTGTTRCSSCTRASPIASGSAWARRAALTLTLTLSLTLILALTPLP